jgi:uncharacterized coiled-coil protein SlyX
MITTHHPNVHTKFETIGNHSGSAAMVEPISTAATCIGLVNSIWKGIDFLVTFAENVSEADQQINDVRVELKAMVTRLEVLQKNLEDEKGKRITLPPTLTSELKRSLAKCESTLRHLHSTVQSYAGRTGFSWATFGQKEAKKWETELSSRNQALNDTLKVAEL